MSIGFFNMICIVTIEPYPSLTNGLYLQVFLIILQINFSKVDFRIPATALGTP
jgi:hypothetical protein